MKELLGVMVLIIFILFSILFAIYLMVDAIKQLDK